jgi:hypothetical protein
MKTILYGYNSEDDYRTLRVISKGDEEIPDYRYFVSKSNFDELESEVTKLREENRIMREALEEVKGKIGFCIFGSTDISHVPEVAYRQGSYQAWCDTGAIAREALEKVK